MRERLVPEEYVKLVQDMYTGCRTKVRTVAGESSKFNVEVGLHQRSALIQSRCCLPTTSCCAETSMWT